MLLSDMHGSQDLLCSAPQEKENQACSTSAHSEAPGWTTPSFSCTHPSWPFQTPPFLSLISANAHISPYQACDPRLPHTIQKGAHTSLNCSSLCHSIICSALRLNVFLSLWLAEKETFQNVTSPSVQHDPAIVISSSWTSLHSFYASQEWFTHLSYIQKPCSCLMYLAMGTLVSLPTVM